MKRQKLNCFIFLIFFLTIFTDTNLCYGQHYPYPIIFVHGLSGSDETFGNTMTHFQNILNWGPINVFDVILNADNNKKSAVLYEDVKWQDWIFAINDQDKRLINVGRRSYLENPKTEQFNDGWHNPDSRLFAINFNEKRVRGASGLFSGSNESAIYKQGFALSQMIREVLDFTNSEKVVLVGHSMGGLVIREYLQRIEGSKRRWWIDPNTPEGHFVAGVVTYGTPHLGSNTGLDPTKRSFIADHNFEALRDLKYLYDSYPNPICENIVPVGIYLFGGNESCLTNTNSTNDPFENVDINCNGNETDEIIGLSKDTTFNKAMPLPDNILYTWIISDLGGFGGDGAVLLERQWLYENNKSMPIGSSYTILTNVSHTSEGSDYNTIIKGLDEPNIPQLALKIETETQYQSIPTIQPNKAIVDDDWYKFHVGCGLIAISLTPATNISGRIDLYTKIPENDSDKNSSIFIDFDGTKKIIFSPEKYFDPGDYFLRIRHQQIQNHSWKTPCTFMITENKAGGIDFFEDIRNHWAEKYIYYVADNGVVEGYNNDSGDDKIFCPDQYITRSEVLKMAYKGSKKFPASDLPNPNFVDLSKDHWAYNYLTDAKAHGYIVGKDACNTYSCSGRCFCPDEPVDKYEAAKIIYKVFDVDSSEINIPESDRITFSDLTTDHWAYEYVYWLANIQVDWENDNKGERIVSGYDNGMFGKDNSGKIVNITRGEMAKIIANLMNFKGTGPKYLIVSNNNERWRSQSVKNKLSTAVTLGLLYEQFYDPKNMTSPDPIQYSSQTISEDETFSYKGNEVDRDGDMVFYFWNTSGGSFTATNMNLSEISWTPPDVSQKTTFFIRVNKGDGRGKVNYGIIEVVVVPSITNIQKLTVDKRYTQFKSVSISNDYAIVGANLSNVPGAAIIFKRQDGNWRQEQELLAPDEAKLYSFGRSVAISGNYAIVGGNGSSVIYKLSDEIWIEQEILPTRYGAASVSISGDYAIIGSRFPDSTSYGEFKGLVRIYKRENDSWVIQAEKSSPFYNEDFGESVSISGDYAIVGAPSIYNKFLAYIYKREGNEWVEQARISPFECSKHSECCDYFGKSVSISKGYVVVSSSKCSYFFKHSDGNWIEQAKFSVTGPVSIYANYAIIGGDGLSLIVGGGEYNSNYAHIYKRENEEWIEQLDFFDGLHLTGRSVSISKNDIIISTSNNSSFTGYSTNVYILPIHSFSSIPKLFVSSHRKTFSMEAGSTLLNIYNIGNSEKVMNWKATSNASWITINNPTGMNDDVLDINYAENDGDDRTAIISVYAENTVNSPQIITVTQFSTPALSIQPVSKNVFHANSGSTLFNIQNERDVSIDWKAKTDASWITIDNPIGTNDGVLTIEYTENHGLERTATISISAENIGNSTQMITITQSCRPELFVEPLSETISSEGGLISVTIQNIGCGIMNWLATTDVNWLTIANPAGINNGVLIIDCIANVGSERISTIRILADGENYEKNIQITQNGLVKWIEDSKLLASDGEKNDFLGLSVSISENYAIVGAQGDDDNRTDSGAAYIFNRKGDTWIEQAKLLASDGTYNDHFGLSVSISGDCAIIGAAESYGSYKLGSVYIFRRKEDNWIEQTKLLASDGSYEDHFGSSVSISGDYAIVGAKGTDDNGSDSGSAYIFRKDGNIWIEQTKLLASDGDREDAFGRSVSISGDYAIVGAYWYGLNSGSAYIFKKDNEKKWIEQAKLMASDEYPGIEFGKSVSISGDYAIIGASNRSAYIFKREDNTWIEEAKLKGQNISVSISGDYAVTGFYSSYLGSGYANIYKREGRIWLRQNMLTASDTPEFDGFGLSVSINEGYAIVGKLGDDDNGSNSGSAYIYKLLPPVPTLTLSTFTKIVSAEQGSLTFDIINNGKKTNEMHWEATTGVSWLTIENSSGTNSGTLNISYTANLESERIANITVIADGVKNSPQIFTLIQTAKSILSVTPLSKEIYYKSGTTSFNIENIGHDAVFWEATTEASWINMDNPLGFGDGILNINYTTNNESFRIATIKITAEREKNSPQVISLIQGGKSQLNVYPLSKSISYENGSFSVNIENIGYGNMNWNATTNVPWLSIENSSGLNDGILIVNYTLNTGPERTGSIDLLAEGASGSPQKLTVLQIGQARLLVLPLSEIVSYESGRLSIHLENTGYGNMEWVAIADASWLTIDKHSGVNDRFLNINYSSNISSERRGSITLIAEGALGSPQTVTIIQIGRPKLSVTPLSEIVSYESGSFAVNIKNIGYGRMEWTASTDVSWLTINNHSGVDDGVLNVNYPSNTGPERTGNIILTSEGTDNSPQIVSVIQLTDDHNDVLLNEPKLFASDGEKGNWFGESVSIYGEYVIVGASGYNSMDYSSGKLIFHPGYACIFKRQNDSWIEQTKLLPFDSSKGDRFGFSVSISGDYAIVGAPWFRSDFSPYLVSFGFAYIFKRIGDAWIEQSNLSSSDQDYMDYFGYSVSISGDYAIVGAIGNDDNGEYSGSAYIFSRDGNKWIERAKLLPSTIGENALFGCSVSISGYYAIVGAQGGGQGSAYIYKKENNIWIEKQKLFASDGEEWEYFGNSVSISGDYAIVGSKHDDDKGKNSGSAYIFKHEGNGWIEQIKLLPSRIAENDLFGNSVSISGKYAVVSSKNDHNDISSGSVYIFKREENNWIEHKILITSDTIDGYYFGTSVSIDGYNIILGSRYNDRKGEYSGAAYLYSLPKLDPIPGDINANGIVNLQDILSCQQVLSGYPQSIFYLEAVDFNGNGKLDVGEQHTLLKLLLEKIE